MEIDFIGGSYKGFSSNVNAQVCRNLFAVLDQTGGKPKSLQGTPGLKYWTNALTTAEDYTGVGWAEVDTGDDRITRAATTITATALNRQNEQVYAYKDFGAGYFSTDFEHRFTFKFTVDGDFYIAPWVLANGLNTWYDLVAANTLHLAFLVYYISATGLAQFWLYEMPTSGINISASVQNIPITVNTTYYMKIVRDDDGGSGSLGLLSAYVYTDSDFSVLLTSVSLDLDEQLNLQYLYGICNTDTPTNSWPFSGVVGALQRINQTGGIRGMHVMGSTLYVVIVNKLYSITTAKVVTELGTLNTSDLYATVYFADNGSKLMLVDGTDGYTWIAAAFATIADADFPANPTSVTYQDGYYIVTNASSPNFYISALDDPTSWAAADYEETKGVPDNLVRAISSQRQLWLLGERSIEVWYNSGNAVFPFERVPGAVQTIGCPSLGAASAAILENQLYWITNDFRAARTNGLEIEFISTSHIEYVWSLYTITHIIGRGMVVNGQAWYVVTFAGTALSKTWVFSATTGLWHEWNSYPSNSEHRGRYYAYFNSDHYAGDHTEPNLYTIDPDTYTDNGQTITRVRTGQRVVADRRNMFFGELEIELEAGVGNASPPSDAPVMTLEISKDGGHTWVSFGDATMGANTVYTDRARWRRLGKARDFIPRLTISEQVKVVILGAHVQAQPGNH